jgi:fructokinase
MILVAGEALMDVLAEPGGRLTALPGGASFNVARATAALGAECTFLGRLSDDGFGEQLRAVLDEAGVALGVSAPTPAPTPLAVATLDAAGSAQYRFYHDHSAASRLFPDAAASALVGQADVMVVGGIVLTVEPARATLLGLLESAPAQLTVLCDPNCRPGAIHDLPAYRQTVGAFLRRADLVKASVEDLALLAPDAAPIAGARRLIAAGPAAVLVTDGPAPVHVVTASEVRAVPVPAVDVVDTIGAGDAFVAGFVTWWTAHGTPRTAAGDPATLETATRSAVEVAARACRVRGAGLAADLTWEAGAA